MKTKRSVPPSKDRVLEEVWSLKEENAAAYGYDIDALAAATRQRQEMHPERVVRRVSSVAEPGTATDPAGATY